MKTQPNNNNDRYLVKLGIRPDFLNIDRSVFKKNDKDRKLIKFHRKNLKQCSGL
mgnify:CR=1 FL=1